jgi:RNA polymerase sigma factor (sigma-70 family)
MEPQSGHDPGSAEHAAEASAALAADREGLARLAELFSRDLARAAYGMLGDGLFAKNLAHDALLTAWDSAGRTSADTPVRAWLLGVVINLCRGHRRSLDRRRPREQAVAESRPETASGEPAAEADRLDALARAMEWLDGPLREVVVLRFQQQLDVAATAAALGVPGAGTRRVSSPASPPAPAPRGSNCGVCPGTATSAVGRCSSRPPPRLRPTPSPRSRSPCSCPSPKTRPAGPSRTGVSLRWCGVLMVRRSECGDRRG